MYKFIGNRGSGKTTRLLEYAARNGYVLVEPTYNQAKYTTLSAHEKGIFNIDIISAREFLTKYMLDLTHPGKKRFVIDELDGFLKCIGVEGYTNTEENCVADASKCEGISW